MPWQRGLIWLLPVAFALAVTGCRPKAVEKRAAGDLVNVSLVPVRELEFKVPVRATGLLGTRNEMKLSFKTGGIIRKVYVSEGEAVKRGTLLAELDLSEIKAQVSQARVALEKSERDLVRAANLYRDSVVTLEQYQDAESGNELAKARMKVADFNLKHSRIIAPANGKIQKILAETNEIIAPGYPVLLFASTEGDWVVRVALTDKDVVKISIGDTAQITMDAFPGEQFRAMVSEMGSIADPFTGSYEVELSIYQPRKEFRTGFFSRALIYPVSTVTSLVVPLEALLDAQDNLASVYVWEDGKATKRRVRTGSVQKDVVVVLDGLKEGALVITDGARFIRKGSQVQPVNLKDVIQP